MFKNFYRSFIFTSNSITQHIINFLFVNNSELIQFSNKVRAFIQTNKYAFDDQKALIEYIRSILVKNDAEAAPQIAKMICDFYPEDFKVSKCPTCKTKDWIFDYAGTKTLPAQLYPGSDEFPFYSREILPLIYGHCKHCGCGQILITPNQHWINPKFSSEAAYGQWMENQSFIEEKLKHTRIHYTRSNLEQFKTHRSSVLEVSPGVGVFLNTLITEFGWKKHLGIEPDKFAYELGKRKFDLNIINNYVYTVRNITNFDLVVFDNSLEHHSDPALALAAAYDYLRPGGGLFIVVPNYHSYAIEKLKINYFNLDWGHWSYFTVQSLHKLVSQANFKTKFAYSSFIEPSIRHLINPEDPKIELTINEYDISNLDPKLKALRGEFIYLIAEKT